MNTRVKLIRLLTLLVIWLMVRPLPASAEVTFLGDWADFGSQFQTTGPQTRRVDGERVEWVAGYGANHWRMVQERGDDRLQVVRDPTSPKGGAVLRVEVRPGDTVGFSGERAEVSYMLGPGGNQYPVTAESGHEVYGISVKLDTDWKPPLHDAAHGNWQWGAIMQLHAPNQSGGPPAFALSATDQFGVMTLAGDLIGSDGKRRDSTSFSLSNGALKLGHWVEFLIDVNWAYDNKGSLVVLRKDDTDDAFVQVFSQMGVPTLLFNSQFPNSRGTEYTHYWKVGYYRSISPGVISRLWLGPLVRGTSQKEVAIAAFGRP